VRHGLDAGKITDLPGVSVGIVPLLARAGVRALHIGTNGMGNQVFPSFPGRGNLPQVFVWRHPSTGDEIVLMNEQGCVDTTLFFLFLFFLYFLFSCLGFPLLFHLFFFLCMYWSIF
jgi:hypothetical protein